MTKIFIVDDHPIVRSGLAQFIESYDDLMVCGEAEDANTAIANINLCNPDIVIADINLKGVSGIELIKAIRNRYSHINVIVLSMHEENEYIERAIQAGAMGYVLKSDNEKLVIDAIETIKKGKTFLSNTLKDKMLDRMLWHTSDDDPMSLNSLTNRELEIFELIGKGLNTRQIASQLNLTISTIGTYRERIKSKLNITSPNELTIHAIRRGLNKNPQSP